MNQTDNVYLNITIDNETNTETPYKAIYNQSRTLPILDKCSDYYMSVIRFDIPLDQVPLTIIPVIPNQPNPNLMTLVVGITNVGNFPENLIYIPDNTATVPVQDQPTQVITNYYYVYNYNNVIRSANNALNAAFIAAGSPGGGSAPIMIFDQNTQLFSFIVEDSFITSGATIFCNEPFVNYFDAFHWKFLTYNSVIGKDYELVYDILPNNEYPTVTYPIMAPYYRFTQEYSSLANWTALRKILITSSTIPARKEFVTTTANSDVTVTFPIITDFIPPLDTSSQSRSIAYYVPTSQYRLVDLVSENPLTNIDLQVYWQDKYGTVHQLLISQQQQLSIKIIFVRKSLYKSIGDIRRIQNNNIY